MSSTIIIHNAEKMTPGMARYWNAKAKKMTGRVNVIDPWRKQLKDLREQYPAGTRVYRASTGGKWGKSASIATL
jgi:hypothetical protein